VHRGTRKRKPRIPPDNLPPLQREKFAPFEYAVAGAAAGERAIARGVAPPAAAIPM
jgi:hypothetical protein